MMHRRDFLKTGAALAATLPLGASADDAGLHTIARAGGRVFGSCSAGLLERREDGPRPSADADYQRLFLRHCGVITTELEFKMLRLRPARDRWDWRAADLLTAFARDHNLTLRGHALVWHESTPAWWLAEVPADRAEAELSEHITTVCSHAGELVETWDVVNEPLDGGTFRRTPMLAQLGPRYIDIAFRSAAQAAPKARLCLNEYGLEYDTGEDQAKRDALLRLLAQMQDSGVPVHMVGIQAHLHPRKRFDAEAFASFLARLRAMGLTVMITELDCYDRRLPANPYTRDRWVARTMRDYLDVALAEPAVEGVVCWGLADRYSWLSTAPGARRWDGLRSRGTLFGDDLRPKAAFNAVKAALTRAAPRA